MGTARDRRHSRVTISRPSRRSVCSRRSPRAVQSWRPGAVSLRETVEREFAVASAGKPDQDLDGNAARFRLALGSVPEGLPCPPRSMASKQGGKAFAHGGVSTMVRSAAISRRACSETGSRTTVRACTRLSSTLQVALAVVKMEAVRHHASEAPSSTWQTVNEALRSADLLLVHLSDTKTLSRRLG